jgi:hypothetical protein
MIVTKRLSLEPVRAVDVPTGQPPTGRILIDGRPSDLVVNAEKTRGQFECFAGTILFLTWLCAGGDDLTILLVGRDGARLDQLGVGFFNDMGEAWLETIHPGPDDRVDFVFGSWRWRLRVLRSPLRIPRYLISASVLSDLPWWAPKWLSVRRLHRA